jgi:hypothetical protein
MTAVIAESRTGRSLIPPHLFDRLVSRIVTDEKLDRALAQRVVDQALAFLAACADSSNREPLAPSELVDLGWHTFILYTRDYREFCRRIAGRFIDHAPTDEHDPAASGEAAHATLLRTTRAIEKAGFTLDAELWPAVSGKCNQKKCTAACTQCHQGCTDSPHH